MAEEAMVTITANEYFELRSKAETNLFLSAELGSLGNRVWECEKTIGQLTDKVAELEIKVRKTRD